MLWNSPRNVRAGSTTDTLGSHKPMQRLLNNLWKPLPKNVKNLKEEREAGVGRQVRIFMRYHSFLFSFNIAKISWLMYSHAGLYVSKCRINHVMWSPQISQAKLAEPTKRPERRRPRNTFMESEVVLGSQLQTLKSWGVVYTVDCCIV